MSQTAIAVVMFVFLIAAGVLYTFFDNVLGVALGVAGLVITLVLSMAAQEMKRSEKRRVSSPSSFTEEEPIQPNDGADEQSASDRHQN